VRAMAAPQVESQPGFSERLARLRELVAPWLRPAAPDKEPRRYLYGLIDEHMSRAGKGLRPALCIATCRAFGGQEEDVLPIAAALEMLHNAFLVHDDIEDGSQFRRDRPTLHVAEGIPLAINVGDAMQALSVRLVRQSVDRLGPQAAWRLFDEFDHMLIESLEGQALEIGWVRDNSCDVTDEDYLRMTLKKTCWYSFIHPCRLGALVAGPGDDDLGRFDAFGYFLGLAFQIQDDILNLVGDPHRYGKEIGGDLWEGKRTLILVDLFSKLPPFEAERLRTVLAKPRSDRLGREIAWMQDLIEKNGSLEVARTAARHFAQSAARAFDTAYAGAPDGEDRRFIRDLVDYVVQRDV
jgi:geranylgeranyl diphosphate synthase, type II